MTYWLEGQAQMRLRTGEREKAGMSWCVLWFVESHCNVEVGLICNGKLYFVPCDNKDLI
jgi:hypothetical protein